MNIGSFYVNLDDPGFLLLNSDLNDIPTHQINNFPNNLTSQIYDFSTSILNPLNGRVTNQTFTSIESSVYSANKEEIPSIDEANSGEVFDLRNIATPSFIAELTEQFEQNRVGPSEEAVTGETSKSMKKRGRPPVNQGTEEDPIQKKAKRQEQVRVAAQTFRNKKKKLISTVENQIEQLQQELKDLCQKYYFDYNKQLESIKNKLTPAIAKHYTAPKGSVRTKYTEKCAHLPDDERKKELTRLVNKEAAKKVRQRKKELEENQKSEVDVLNATIKELKDQALNKLENNLAEAEKKNVALVEENQELRAQMLLLRQIIQQNGLLK